MKSFPRCLTLFKAKLYFLPALVFTLAGCSPAPSVVLFGASFPDWLLCAVTGMAGMTVIHVLVSRSRYHKWFLPAPVVYPCLTALVSMLTWLLVFPN
ncbi:YtcA family lipoprotein [Enterobacter roggenkampii]|uniref:YtcA family lipoprotein n=1 Tax=Enterobacter roggenkampii TaxID=1812935 RepID=UPI000DA10D83|nr:YtcA family lipoprotein [Enterobacter roggenkampii]